MASRIDDFGTPKAYNHYAVGWAHAMDTPYQWTKQVASHWGGTRNGTIVRWPNGIKAKGEIRNQFHHVIDVAPTVLEAAGLPAADASSTASSRRRSRASRWPTRSTTRTRAERHTTQYFEMFVNRGIYHEGWTAVTRHSIPWDLTRRAARVRRRRLGALRPRRLDAGARTSPPSSRRSSHGLQRLFLIEAAKYNVLPLDDRRVERFNADLAGRPQLIQGNTQILFGGMGRLTENSVVVLKNKSHAVTAEIVVPDGGATGVIVAQGGAFGGWSLYAHEGKPAYCYNLFGLQQFKVYGDERAPRRRAPGAGGVRLRRRRARQGRHGHALRRRREGRRGPGRRDRADGLLGRRDADVGGDTARP